MTEDTIVVQLHNNPTDRELKRVREKVFEVFNGEYHVVVTTDDMAIHELPALDDYADELAERVASKLREGDAE